MQEDMDRNHASARFNEKDDLMKIKFTSVLVALVALSACTGNPGEKQTGGTLIGAGIGALLGSQIGSGKGQFAAVAIGTLAGAMVGGEVGKSLDKADRAAMERSTSNALESGPSGQSVAWNNPDSGNYGEVVPQPAYRAPTGEYCREYQQTVTVAGRSEEAYGKACRQPDGSWKIIK
jgi:surface antigen